jgi:hypothetical protein
VHRQPTGDEAVYLRNLQAYNAAGRPCSLLPSILIVGQGRCLFHKYDSIRLE